MQYKPLSSEHHGQLRLTRGSFFFLNEQPLVPVSVVEASRAALDLPLVFVRGEQGTRLMALLSLERNVNAQVGPKGLWMGGYMPAAVRAYPFALAIAEDQATVVVAEESDWLSPIEGEPLFDLAGQPTETTSKMIQLLKNRFPNPLRDNVVFKAVEESGLLQPWTNVSENLLRVDREKLAGLDETTLLTLHRAGALGVIHAHLISLPRINRIKNLAQRKKKMAEQQVRAGKQAAGKQSLDFSLEEDDELISFDF
jgi:hypothetical protein